MISKQWLRLALYPVTLLLVTPIRLLQALTSLLKVFPEFENYNRFTSKHGINSIFYWTQALNIQKYGRSGVSPTLGLGSYKLWNWFYFSKPSYYFYWKFRVLAPVISILCWTFSNLLWLRDVPLSNVQSVLLLAVISTTFYANIFCLQNYNALGWAFFPALVYSLLKSQWELAAVSLLMVSMGSFTVFLLGGFLILTVFLISGFPVHALLTPIPACIYIAAGFLPALRKGDLIFVSQKVLKGIGVISSSQARYTRPRSRRQIIIDVYNLLLYVQFAVAYYFHSGMVHPLLLTGIVTYFVSAFIARLGDRQSFSFFNFSLITAICISDYSPFLLVSYWLAVSPLPLTLGITTDFAKPDIPPRLKPFNVRVVLQRVGAFLEKVRPNQRILMCFDDPHGTHSSIFDGYRSLIEPVSFIGSDRGFHVMPDWWAVFETNFEGAPDFWGRSVCAVKSNIRTWAVDYVIVYQQSGTQLENHWPQHGFKTESTLDWSCLEEYLRAPYLPWDGPAPKWWLLKVPASNGL